MAEERVPTPKPETLVKFGTFCAYLKESGSPKYAYTQVGWSKPTAYHMRDTYPQFREMWDDALEQFAGSLHKELGDAAFGRNNFEGKQNVHALIQMNRAHNPELFAPQVRHQGQVQHYHTLVPLAQDIHALPDAEYPQLADEIDGDFSDLEDE